MACGLIAAMRACSDQLAWMKAMGSRRCAASSMSASSSRSSAMSAGDACQSASSISSGSRASRIRTASATGVSAASSASTELPRRTIRDCAAANTPPPGPGRTEMIPRDCAILIASLKVPTDTSHWARSSSFEPSRSPGSAALAMAMSCAAALSARGGRAAGRAAADCCCWRCQSCGRSAGTSKPASPGCTLILPPHPLDPHKEYDYRS